MSGESTAIPPKVVQLANKSRSIFLVNLDLALINRIVGGKDYEN